ncbi:MAG: SBBP repeat-containing protein [Anaerolineales bacterium]|nr:SBBP repeat-containing protein [Anaerolineales bacterium]
MKPHIFTILTMLIVSLLLIETTTTQTTYANNQTNPSFSSTPKEEASPTIIEKVNTSIEQKIPNFNQIPSYFIENIGQFDEQVHFQVPGEQSIIRLADDAIWITLLESPSNDNAAHDLIVSSLGDLSTLHQFGDTESKQGVNIRISFANANPSPHLQPFNPLKTTVNDFRSSTPDQWQTNIPTWGGIRYVDLYPGIDLELVADSTGQFAPRIRCHTNCQAGLSAVQLQIDGADTVKLTEDHLNLTTSIGKFTLPFFDLIMDYGSTQTNPEWIPRLNGNTVTYPFTTATLSAQSTAPQSVQDKSSDLLYGTFLGGSSWDNGNAIAIDTAGQVYLIGNTQSTDFPTTPGAFDLTYNSGNRDAFVIKLNAAGSELIYATFIGGNDDDVGKGIVVDNAGQAYITGLTRSPDFPTSAGAYDTTLNGSYDIFAAKLNDTGNALLYATFLGGSSADASWGHSLVVDGAGQAYLTGDTDSTDFPTTSGAFDTTHNGSSDSFLVKLNAAGSEIAYATLLGGSDIDRATSITLDSEGFPYITGYTWSTNFPTTAGAYDTTHNGERDVFVVKMNAAGSDPIFSTFLGGSSADECAAVAIDNTGQVYLAGHTYSSNFPTTSGAFDTTYNSKWDAFLAKLNATGSELVYSTLFGDSGDDVSRDIYVNDMKHAYIVGYTGSSAFPTTSNAFDTVHNGGTYDAFVADMDTTNSEMLYATFLGGSADDYGSAIVVSSGGQAYIAGSTNSVNFPTTSGAFATTNNGSSDAFAIKLGGITPIPAAITDLQAGSGTEAGEINLTWTAPSNIDSNMNYQVRYAGSEITTELSWTSATPASGVPAPTSAGSLQNMTVSGLTPGQTYYFAVRVEYKTGSLSPLSNNPSAAAKNAPDLLFRPNPDGYQFVNPGFLKPTCVDFQQSYSSLDIQCVNGEPQQEYQALFADYKKTFSTGICTGMATSSLLYFTGTDSRPQSGTTFELDMNQAKANIAAYHGRQHSQAVLDVVLPAWNNWRGDSSAISQQVDAVYNQIKASLSSSNNNNPLILDLFPRPDCGTSGHTVAPYRLDTSDPLRPKVYIYDNFNPGDANKFIQFDFSTSVHRFSYWLWDSASCGALVAIPVNTFTSAAAKTPGTQLHVSTGGSVEPLLVNAMGEMVGYDNGNMTATLPDAMPVFPWQTSNSTPPVSSFLVPADMYTTTLNTSGGGYTFTVWSPSGTLDLQGGEQNIFSANNLLSVADNDTISFSADLRNAVLSTSEIQAQPMTLQMSIPDTNNSQVYTLDNVVPTAGGNLTVAASDSELTVNSDGITTNYDVSFDRISSQTVSTFSHANLTISASDIHIITFSDGGNALLQIDQGGDGSIDQDIVLENEANTFYTIYLPAVLRP